jgi:hypothetical protein
MGFTREAVKKYPGLLRENQDRAWDLWNEPTPDIPQAVTAFKLVFPTSELAITPDMRTTALWNNVVYIDIWKALPPGWMTVVTLFVTTGDREPRHEVQPSFWLASLDIGDGRYAQLVAHGDPEGNIHELVANTLAIVREQAKRAERKIPRNAYAYMLATRPEGVRYIVGAQVNR